MIYRVTTTFLGADGPSSFYFASREKAQSFLDTQCTNGEITECRCNINIPGGVQMWTYTELLWEFPDIKIEEA